MLQVNTIALTYYGGRQQATCAPQGEVYWRAIRLVPKGEMRHLYHFRACALLRLIGRDEKLITLTLVNAKGRYDNIPARSRLAVTPPSDK